MNKNLLNTCICQALPVKVLYILRVIRNGLIFKVVYNLMGRKKYKQRVTHSGPAAAKQEHK